MFWKQTYLYFQNCQALGLIILPALCPQTCCTAVCSAVSLYSHHRVSLVPRQNLPRIILKGIFQGVKVVRGPDWDWGNQDGEWSCVYSGWKGMFLTAISVPSCTLSEWFMSTDHNIVLTLRLINLEKVITLCVSVWLIWDCSQMLPVLFCNVIYFSFMFVCVATNVT